MLVQPEGWEPPSIKINSAGTVYRCPRCCKVIGFEPSDMEFEPWFMHGDECSRCHQRIDWGPKE